MKRTKRRYLALQVEIEGSLSERELLDEIWSAVRRLYGEHGASQTGLAQLEFNEDTKTAITRVSLVALQQVRAALASITHITDREGAVHVIAISGTIKSLRKQIS